MLFKELKQNSTVYLLKRDGFTYLEGRVKESGIPHYDQRAVGGMVVDITIETEGEYYTYVFDENKEVYNGKGLIISTTKEGLVKEIERMKNGAMEILASVKEQEEILKKIRRTSVSTQSGTERKEKPGTKTHQNRRRNE